MEKEITVENFENEVVSVDKAVVDFWATWCMPCKMIAPEIEKLAKEMDGNVLVGKVNVDEQMPLAEKFEIDMIPAILYFEKGQLKDKIVGVVNKDEIIKKFGL